MLEEWDEIKLSQAQHHAINIDDERTSSNQQKEVDSFTVSLNLFLVAFMFARSVNLLMLGIVQVLCSLEIVFTFNGIGEFIF